jgi:hypothetical protein
MGKPNCDRWHICNGRAKSSAAHGKYVRTRETWTRTKHTIARYLGQVPQHAEALQAREVHVTLHRTLVLVEPHAVHPVLDVPQDDAPLRAGVHV